MTNIKVDFSQISSSVNKLLVLSALVQNHDCGPSEIYEIILSNDIDGFNYHALNKLLSSMIEENLIKKTTTHTYQITYIGREMLPVLLEKIRAIYNTIINFKTKMNISEKKKAEILESLYRIYGKCPGIKIVPYSVFNLDVEDEDDFFLYLLPENNNIFEFTGRGLGQGDFSNYLVCFKNNNYLKYIAVIDKYEADALINGHKFIPLKRGSIKKLQVPISVKDIQTSVDPNFHFIRNKQTFDKETHVQDFIDLVIKHL